jgi:hypothetical protein
MRAMSRPGGTPNSWRYSRLNCDGLSPGGAHGDVDSAQAARLDEASQPALNFPAHYNTHLAPNLAFAGATVDGVKTSSPVVTAGSARY